MKKIVLSLSAGFIITALVFVSCDKQVTKPVQEELTKIGTMTFSSSEIHSLESIETLLSKCNETRGPIIRWIKKHTGTHLFNNCSGTHPCGPCPGICIPLAIVSQPDEDGVLTQAEIADHMGLMATTNIDGVHMRVSFNDNSLYTTNNTFYVPQDIELGPQSAAIYEASSFIIKKGVYPLGRGGQTVINVELR
ncbi:MAG: hypothetical protein IPH89_12875 [Bacteroidetes bacterium]|jgi:hypothetical protein|nr:hypothetical protein [Bacteroidota bacterium]